MKRYLVFAGDAYYPAGGWDDFREAFNTLDEAKEYAETIRRKNASFDHKRVYDTFDWQQIVDLEKMEKMEPDL